MNGGIVLKKYSRKEAAEILGISLSTLDKLRAERKIGYYQAGEGCKVQFTQEDLDKYMKRVKKAALADPRQCNN